MLRAINRRLKRKFQQDARLLEAAVRNVAVFSSQTKEAAAAAAEITLISEDDESPSTDRGENQPRQLIMPPGVRSTENSQPQTTGMVDMTTGRFESTVDELPDDETRQAVVDRPAEDKNKAGSFENLLRFAGNANVSGGSTPV